MVNQAYLDDKKIKDILTYISGMGHSYGASLGARYGHLYPKIKRTLLINSHLFFNWHLIKDGMKQFTGKLNEFINLPNKYLL